MHSRVVCIPIRAHGNEYPAPSTRASSPRASIRHNHVALSETTRSALAYTIPCVSCSLSSSRHLLITDVYLPSVGAAVSRARARACSRSRSSCQDLRTALMIYAGI